MAERRVGDAVAPERGLNPSARSSSPPILRALDMLGDYYCGDVEGSLQDENPLSSPSSVRPNSTMGFTVRDAGPVSISTPQGDVEDEDDDQRPGQQSYEEYLREAAAASVSGELSEDLASKDGAVAVDDDQRRRKSSEEDHVSMSPKKTAASPLGKPNHVSTTPTRSLMFTPKNHGVISPFSPLLNVSKHGDRPFELSLSNARKVSVVVRIDQSQDGKDDSCLFPVVKGCRNDSPLSPNDYSWNDIVVVNPSAFGKDIPTTVTMERARLVSQVARQSSEDWIRSYRFSQVVWSDLEVESTRCWVNLCRAMAQDVTISGSISSRTVISVGNTRSSKNRTVLSPSSVSMVSQVPSRTEIVFGSVACDSVAHVLAQDSVGVDQKNRLLVLQRYGLLGLTAQEILEPLDNENKTLPARLAVPVSTQYEASPSRPERRLTLSMLEIADEDIVYDLLKLKPFARENAVKVKYQGGKSVAGRAHEGGLSAASLVGVTDTPVDSLRTLGRCVRRAFTMAYHSRRTKPRGTVLAILKLWDPTDTGRHTTVQFCDVGEVVPEDHGSFWRESQKGRNSRLRQSLTALGAVLRRILLREAGNQTAISFREHTLTQVLSRGLANFDSRVIVLANLSSQSASYSETLATLRFVSSILTRPGDPLLSPFDDNTKATSPTSRSSAGVESLISSSSLDMQHGALLRDLLADPRQRIAKLVKPAKNSRRDEPLDLSGETYVPTMYMDMDPGAAATALGQRADGVANFGELAIAALPASVAFEVPRSVHHNDGSDSLGDAKVAVDAMGGTYRNEDALHLGEPSPLTTDTGTGGGTTGASFDFRDLRRHPGYLEDAGSTLSSSSKELKRLPQNVEPGNGSGNDDPRDEFLEINQALGGTNQSSEISVPQGSGNNDYRAVKGKAAESERTGQVGIGDFSARKQRMEDSTWEPGGNEDGHREAKRSLDIQEPLDEDSGRELKVLHTVRSPPSIAGSFREESTTSVGRTQQMMLQQVQRLQSEKRIIEDEILELRDSLEVAQLQVGNDIAVLTAQLKGAKNELAQKAEEAQFWRDEVNERANESNEVPNLKRQIRALKDEQLSLQARGRHSMESIRKQMENGQEENRLLHRKDEGMRALRDRLETASQSAELSAHNNAVELERLQRNLDAQNLAFQRDTNEEMEWLRQAVETRDVRISELQEASANLERQIEDSNVRIHQDLELERARHGEMMDQLHQMESELEKCKAEAAKKDAALIRLQGSLDVVNRNLEHSQQEAADDVEVLKQRVLQLQMQLDRELETHRLEIRRRDEEFALAKEAMLSKHRSERECQSEAIQSLGNDLDQARALIGDRESRIRELTSAVESVESGRVEVLKIAEEAIATQAELEQKVAYLEEELRGIESRSVPLERLLATERSHAEIAGALEKTQAELLRMTADRDNMQVRITELQCSLQSVEKERDHLLQRKTENEREISRLEALIQSLRSSSNDEESLRTENRQLLEELTQIKSHWSAVESELARQLQEREGEARSYREDLVVVKNELAHVIAEQRASATVRERELMELRETATAAEEELARTIALTEDAERARGQERETTRRLTLELERLKSDLSRRDFELQSLSEKLDQALEEREAAVAKSAAFKRALSQFQESTRSRVVNFVHHRSETKALLDRTLDENQALAEQNRRLQAALDGADRNPLGPLGRERAEALRLLEECRKENAELRATQSGLMETIDLLRNELESSHTALSRSVPSRATNPTERFHRQADRDRVSDGAEGLLRQTLRSRAPSLAEQHRYGYERETVQARRGSAVPPLQRGSDLRNDDHSARSAGLEPTSSPNANHSENPSWPPRATENMVVSIALAAKESAEVMEACRLQLQTELLEQQRQARAATVEALNRRVQLLEKQSARSDAHDLNPKRGGSMPVKAEDDEDDVLHRLSRRVAILERRLDP